jgi:hypothetical protein
VLQRSLLFSISLLPERSALALVFGQYLVEFFTIKTCVGKHWRQPFAKRAAQPFAKFAA